MIAGMNTDKNFIREPLDRVNVYWCTSKLYNHP